jgi:hypothetical protein
MDGLKSCSSTGTAVPHRRGEPVAPFAFNGVFAMWSSELGLGERLDGWTAERLRVKGVDEIDKVTYRMYLIMAVSAEEGGAVYAFGNRFQPISVTMDLCLGLWIEADCPDDFCIWWLRLIRLIIDHPQFTVFYGVPGT